MITIIGDNFEELAFIQDIIDSGLLNLSTNSSINSINATYKLSSGNRLLVNKYNHIVGEQGSISEDVIDDKMENNDPKVEAEDDLSLNDDEDDDLLD